MPMMNAAVSSTSYVLIHTLGCNTPDDMGGDGAYAKWLHEHFSRNTDPQGCVDVQRLVFKGCKAGTTEEIISRMCRQFKKDLEKYLATPAWHNTRTIILNWHIRYTGRPNAWSGRGSSQGMIEELKQVVEQAGYKLIVLYTVHEAEGLGSTKNKWRYEPSSLIALNPDVQQQIAEKFKDRNVALSRVPGLMTCVHTSSVDHILQYLQGEPPIVMSTAASVLLQQLRLCAVPSKSANYPLIKTQGVVVFGMITERHGLSHDIIGNLCKRIEELHKEHHVDELKDFKVVIAGKTQTTLLAKELQEMAKMSNRLVFHGELDQLDGFTSLAGCRYAISFDPLGFRDNASAQVNVIRAGHLLFSRNSNEESNSMIERALAEIIRCEQNPEHYTRALAAQSERFINNTPNTVGNELDVFLRSLAARESGNPALTSAEKFTQTSGCGLQSPNATFSPRAGLR